MSRLGVLNEASSLISSTAQTSSAVAEHARENANGRKLRILVVTLFIAPSTMVGAKRFQFLAREMVGCGHEVHLLGLRELGNREESSGDESSPHTHYAGWYPLLGGLTGNRLVRALRRYWIRYIAPIDRYGGWILPVAIKGIGLARRRRVDVVIVTGPSFSTFLAGYLIHRATDAALILDYRDPWTWHQDNSASAPRRGLRGRIEEAVVRAASAVVVVTDQLKSDFLACFPRACGDNVHVVTNGLYCRESLSGLAPQPRAFNVVYAGKFYGERNASYLIDAVAVLRAEGLIGEGDFMFHVFGVLTAADKDRAKQRGVFELVREWGFKPYDEVLTYLRGADLLYLPSGGEYQYAIPFKFFDYLSVARPILAVAPSASQLAKIVRGTGAGEVADVDDQNAVANILRKMIREGGRRRASAVEQFLWGRLAQRYLELVSATVDARRETP